MNHSLNIRLARAGEVKRIAEIEDLAGERYADAELPPDLDGLAHAVIARAIAEELLWVMAKDDEPVGFALCCRYPDALHLRELDVLPDSMGQGLGRRLVEHVCGEAAKMGLRSVTLTTFRDIVWNAPMYRRWGFDDVEPAQQPLWLRQIRDQEDNSDLRHWPRVAMARTIASDRR